MVWSSWTLSFHGSLTDLRLTLSNLMERLWGQVEREKEIRGKREMPRLPLTHPFQLQPFQSSQLTPRTLQSRDKLSPLCLG